MQDDNIFNQNPTQTFFQELASYGHDFLGDNVNLVDLANPLRSNHDVDLSSLRDSAPMKHSPPVKESSTIITCESSNPSNMNIKQEFTFPENNISFQNEQEFPINEKISEPQPIFPIFKCELTERPLFTVDPSSISAPSTTPTIDSMTITSTSDDEMPISVEIKHKPRNFKGAWFPIRSGERIRVDKRKGKLLEILLKFAVDSAPRSHDFQPQIYLDDLFSGTTQLLQPEIVDGPTIRLVPAQQQFKNNIMWLEYRVRVRLQTNSRRQCFRVAISSLSGELVWCRSTEFCSDDNGRPFDHTSYYSGTAETATTTAPLPKNSRAVRSHYNHPTNVHHLAEIIDATPGVHTRTFFSRKAESL